MLPAQEELFQSWLHCYTITIFGRYDAGVATTETGICHVNFVETTVAVHVQTVQSESVDWLYYVVLDRNRDQVCVADRSI